MYHLFNSAKPWVPLVLELSFGKSSGLPGVEECISVSKSFQVHFRLKVGRLLLKNEALELFGWTEFLIIFKWIVNTAL